MRTSLTPKDIDDLHKLKIALENPENAAVFEVSTLWQNRRQGAWIVDLKFYQDLSLFFLERGDPLLGFDVAQEGLSEDAYLNDSVLKQRSALALARVGATRRANEILCELERNGHADSETLGILGRTYKDLWEQNAYSAEGEWFLRKAADTYIRAYLSTKDYYPGINAAALTLLCGDRPAAEKLAAEIKDTCLAVLNNEKSEYWILATLGEAELILDNRPEAEKWYRAAFEIGRGKWADIQSSRRQARRILSFGNADTRWIDMLLPIPTVVMFVGHMIDRPDRGSERFPPHLEKKVAEAIVQKIRSLSQLGDRDEYFCYGFASCALGGDILFHESLQALGGESHVVLPYDKSGFIEDSVNIVDPTGDHLRWDVRCEQILGRAAEVFQASDKKLSGGSESYEYANLILHGLAKMKADQLDTELVGLVLWDEESGDGAGGTASNIKRWKEITPKVSLEVISTKKILAHASRDSKPSGVWRYSLDDIRTSHITHAVPSSHFGTHILGLLFADVRNFSMLTEAQMPQFTDAFLGSIAALSRHSKNAPIMKNTWGDAIFFVFETVQKTGMFALELRELVNGTKWEDKGLPADLNLRIAVHVGPVYSSDDPITERVNYFGTHVTRTARMEPKTPAGEVYAGREFAALATADGIDSFACDYVGRMALAKDFGTYPIYHLRATARGGV